MKNQRTFQVKVRKPTDNRFGDFIITDVNLNTKKALADFGGGATTKVDISSIVDKLESYSARNKRYYVRMV